MKPILLIDFGSTYTKLTAVDIDREIILGTAASYTTVQTDINDGLKNALSILKEKIGEIDFESCYACSSAAGGLRMVTSGLVPDLTVETDEETEALIYSQVLPLAEDAQLQEAVRLLTSGE